MTTATAVTRLNLGCGRNHLPDWINVDREPLDGVDVVADLEARLPFEDDSVSEMLMSHVLEHIRDALGLMQELWRIAKPDAILTVRCPYGSSDDAWEDPTHVRAMFLQSWGYFSQPFYHRADYGYRGDWQPDVVQLVVGLEHIGTPNTEMFRQINSERNIVTEMIATLHKVSPIREPRRELRVLPIYRIVAHA